MTATGRENTATAASRPVPLFAARPIHAEPIQIPSAEHLCQGSRAYRRCGYAGAQTLAIQNIHRVLIAYRLGRHPISALEVNAFSLARFPPMRECDLVK
jgi:hypothetical protein